MARNDIKNSSLLKTKFLIYAFNGRTDKKGSFCVKILAEKWTKPHPLLASPTAPTGLTPNPSPRGEGSGMCC